MSKSLGGAALRHAPGQPAPTPGPAPTHQPICAIANTTSARLALLQSALSLSAISCCWGEWLVVRWVCRRRHALMHEPLQQRPLAATLLLPLSSHTHSPSCPSALHPGSQTGQSTTASDIVGGTGHTHTRVMGAVREQRGRQAVGERHGSLRLGGCRQQTPPSSNTPWPGRSRQTSLHSP